MLFRNIIIIILLFPSPSVADEWTKSDTALQVIFTGLLLVDRNQTLEIAKYAKKSERCYGGGINWECGDFRDINPHYEKNGLLGKSPSKGKINRYFIITGLGHWWVSDKLGDVKLFNLDWRKIWQGLWIGTEYNVVTHNKRNGFKYSLSF